MQCMIGPELVPNLGTDTVSLIEASNPLRIIGGVYWDKEALSLATPGARDQIYEEIDFHRKKLSKFLGLDGVAEVVIKGRDIKPLAGSDTMVDDNFPYGLIRIFPLVMTEVVKRRSGIFTSGQIDLPGTMSYENFHIWQTLKNSEALLADVHNSLIPGTDVMDDFLWPSSRSELDAVEFSKFWAEHWTVCWISQNL